MSSTTNTAINSRSLNGIISISDGVAILESGNLECNDINSSSINTTTLSTNNLTCKGTFLSNTNGTYTIPITTTSITGSLISYNNTNGNGETDFTNYGSTYNTLLQGFRFWNVNSTQTLTNLAIIDNTQTYFKSQLVGCSAETPLNPTSIVNKNYVDNNFVNFSSDQTITGTKRFNTIFTGDHSWRDVGSPFSNRVQSYVSGTTLEFVPQFNSNIYRFNTKDGASTQTTPLIINSASTTITNSLITNNLTADNITGTQNIFVNNTTGTINIGTGQISGGTINIGGSSTPASNINIKSDFKVFKGMLMYDVSSPYTNFCQLYPQGSNMNYIMNAGATTASTHTFYAYNNANQSKNALTISYTNVNVLEGLILSCRQIRSSNASSGFHELFSGMTTGGVLTMGSLTSSIINNSTTTNNGQATFNNSTPICSVATPTANDHLTRKDYIDNNFIYKTGNLAESISGVKTFLNRINCNGGTALIVAGLAQFNGNTEFFTTTYFVNNPPISYITPTDLNHLTRKGYVDGNFVGLTTTNSITGVNTFSNNTNFSSSLTFTDVGSFSTIQQNSAVLNIENPSLGSTIRLKTRPSIGAVQNSLTINTTSCDILSPTLNLTGTSPINILSPNNLNGTINLFNNLTIGGTLNIGSSVGVNTINGNTTLSNTLSVTGVSTFTDIIICDNGATFNSVIPTTNISATSGDELVNYTTLTSQGFITSSSILSANNNFTGFNTFSSGLTVKSTLLLKDIANVLTGSIDLISGGLLNISCSVNSGKIILSTHDSTGASYNRLFVNENEVNITAPLTLSVDYSYYNPGVFTSTRLGYSKSNTGASNTLTNNNVNNSGRINIDAGSWNISYTATLTVISATLTTLKSLEVYVGDVALNDLNIIGINVLNYYNISSVPIGQKIKISGSGNYISYTNVTTELNLLILPLFTAGVAGLTFQGKISATRNA